jgi:hypothetical protein
MIRWRVGVKMMRMVVRGTRGCFWVLSRQWEKLEKKKKQGRPN